MFGLAPGLYDTRAAMLANQGFAALGLAYVGYVDLSKSDNRSIDMDYFEVFMTDLVTCVEID